MTAKKRSMPPGSADRSRAPAAPSTARFVAPRADRPETHTEWIDPDDAPDLSTPKYQRIIEAVPVVRGRPKKDVTKVSTTLRLDADIVERFRDGGTGWQTRINDALREWLASRRRA